MKGLKFIVLLCMGLFLWVGYASAAIYPSQDVMIVESNTSYTAASNTNFASWGYLTVNWSTKNTNRGLLQFDLSSLTGPVPQMSLFLYHKRNVVIGATFDLYQITEAWNAQKVTWNTAPAIAAAPFSTLIISDPNYETWRSFDVTDMVNDWLSGVPNYGMMLVRRDQGNPVAYFDSSRAQSPYLTPSQVPLPGAVFLFGPGMVGLAVLRRKFKR